MYWVARAVTLLETLEIFIWNWCASLIWVLIHQVGGRVGVSILFVIVSLYER